MNSKPSINDFVEQRWMDAKAILRKQDPDYIRKIETRGQSEQHWLTPASGLSSKWRSLLESCDELYLLATMVQAAAAGLTPFPYLHGDLSYADIGQFSTYNGRSWFVHTKALAERTKDVICKTIQVYTSNDRAAKKIANRHCEAVTRQVENHATQFEQQGTVRGLRNEFAHGYKPSWASEITKSDDDHGYLWEAFIAGDLTPQRRIEEGFFSTIGEDTISGKYCSVVEDTKDVFDHLASILHELDENIAVHNAQADFRSVEEEK